MRAIVRLLPRVLLLGVTAAAIVVLADHAQDAGADTPAPDAGALTLDSAPPPTTVTAPAPTTVTAPATPPPPTLPSAPAPPQPPPLTAPALPATPTVPGVSPAGLPSLPGLPDDPAAPTPVAPEVPGAPGVDPSSIIGILGPLPGLPSVTPPQTLLPPLPELPDAPLPVMPLREPLPPDSGPIGIAVVPETPTAAGNAPVLAATAPPPEPGESRVAPVDVGSIFTAFEHSSAPARAPPGESPLRPCPGGGTTHSGRDDPAGFPPPGADLATRRAALLAEARSYASTWILDPLLRPD